MFKAMFWFVLVPALLPVVLVLWYVYSKDKYEREPLGLVLKVVFFGALFSLGCIPAERMLGGTIAEWYGYDTSGLRYALMQNVLGVALIEEGAKWLVVMLFIWSKDDFDFRYDGIVYAVSSALGFAGMENIMYVSSYGAGVSIGRAMFSIPGHAAFGVFMGFFLSRARHWSLKGHPVPMLFSLCLSVAVPTAIHGLYDFLLSEPARSAGYDARFLPFVLFMDVVAWLMIRHEFRTDRPLGE